MHFWLPGAHANAPSHVSAVMSAVVLNMGVYGLVRMASLLPDLPASAGGVLLALGTGGAVLGAALAVAQADVKRLLAYSSVDNMAIAVAALGLAVLGRSMGREDLMVLGVAGAVWHVWNHSLFKSLFFFAAGAAAHATGTQRLDSLGGLARAMPVTAATGLVASLSLAGLPPLNGFLGELLLYVGLARSASGAGWPALAAVWWVGRRAPVPRTGSATTWDCAGPGSTPQVQLTPTSFSRLATDLFGPVVGPRRSPPGPSGVLPGRGAFSESVPDPVLDRVALPALRVAARFLTWLRLIQTGRVQAYVLYILVALLALLWAA